MQKKDVASPAVSKEPEGRAGSDFLGEEDGVVFWCWRKLGHATES